MEEHAGTVAAAARNMSTVTLDDDLFETVAADYLARFRAGETPSLDDYTQRHPEIAAEIRELFPTMLAIERMKLQKEQSSDGRASLGARQLERLGDFRIIREVGRGGMGIVFEAEQESLQRHVALKVLPPHALQDASHVRRFHREAQTAAALHHTNIVPVFGVGEDDGLHYYVMQLIDGEPLDRRLQAKTRDPLDPRRAADMVRQIAEAVQYAHDHGTLHRDIKPANLLLDKSGNVWITDFGLAQVMERDETVTDHVAGTLRYMAPERFRGVTDERSDQYSLGITLYELVTGARAFEGTSSGEMLHRITQSEPTAVRLLAPDAPLDLQTIIEKAISKDPSHRYARVGDMAHDLERFLDGRPILARPVSSLERAWRWSLRNRALAGALATAAALLLVTAGVLIRSYVQTRNLNADLTSALEKEQSALKKVQAAVETARLAAEKERQARESAEAITTLALDGLDSVFDEFAPSAPYTVALPVARDSTEDDEPLLLPAQATVSPQVASALERLLPLYRQLADQTGQDPHVRLRAASAQYRLGLIYRQLGRQDAARTALWAARSLLEALEDQAAIPQSELRLPLAKVLNDLGDLDRQQPQQFRERRAAFQQALALLANAPLEQLSGEERLELARTHFNLGRRDGFWGPPPDGGPGGRGGPGRGDRGRDGADRDGFGRGGSDRDGFGRAGPDRDGSNRDGRRGPEGDAERSRPEPGRPPLDAGTVPPSPLGDARPPELRDRGGPPGRSDGGRGTFGDMFASREETRRHLTTAIQLLEQFPHGDRDTRVRLLLARAYREQSAQRTREDPASRTDWETAVALLKQLVTEAPETPDFRFELSEVYADVEPRFMPDDRLAEAEPRLRDALALSSALVAEAPDVPAYVAGETQTLVKLANILRRTGRAEEARQRLNAALTLQNDLAAKFPGVPIHVIWTARIKRSLADVLLADERFDEAISLLEQAAQAIESISQSQDRRDDPAFLFASWTLEDVYRMLGDILEDQGRTTAAAEYHAKSRAAGPSNRFRPRPPFEP